MALPLLLLATTIGYAGSAYCGTCGLGCSDCSNADYGSCKCSCANHFCPAARISISVSILLLVFSLAFSGGNACCKLDLTISGKNTSDVVAMLNATLSSGGIDGAFTPSVLAEGVAGFADLRSVNKPVDFIGQFIHTTSGAARYNDSISVTIAPTGSGDSIVRLFSYSLIGGAYGDSGQNYKNLKMVTQMYASHENASSYSLVHVDTSCPEP